MKSSYPTSLVEKRTDTEHNTFKYQIIVKEITSGGCLEAEQI